MTATIGDIGGRLARWQGNDQQQQVRVLARARHHSHLVRRLRFILPLLGVGVIVVMLLANGQLLFAFGPLSVGRVSIEDGMLKMENPRLSGYSQGDQNYELSADSATQDMSNRDVVHLQGVSARITEQDGRWTTVTARSGVFNSGDDTLLLEQNVVVRNDQGYEVRLETANVALKSGNVVSGKPVEVHMLEGLLRANRMQVENKGERMFFEGGVTLHLRRDATEKVVDQQ